MDVHGRVILHIDLDCFYCQVSTTSGQDGEPDGVGKPHHIRARTYGQLEPHAFSFALLLRFISRLSKNDSTSHAISQWRCSSGAACTSTPPRHAPNRISREGLIAVNYAARAEGVTRHMRVADALAKCPSLRLVHVQTIGAEHAAPSTDLRSNSKACLERYRAASMDVLAVVHRVEPKVRRVFHAFRHSQTHDISAAFVVEYSSLWCCTLVV